MASGQIVGHTYVADDGRSWDLDAMVRTDPDGSTHPQAEWSADELATVTSWRDVVWRQDRVKLIRKEVGNLRLRSASADADYISTADKVTAAQTQAAQIKGSTPALTVAYVTAIRDKLGIVADALVDLLQWRQQADSYISSLCMDVAWLGALAVDLTDDPPPPA